MLQLILFKYTVIQKIIVYSNNTNKITNAKIDIE